MNENSSSLIDYCKELQETKRRIINDWVKSEASKFLAQKQPLTANDVKLKVN